MKDIPDFRLDTVVVHLWTIFLLHLKLNHVILWDWIWIFAPIWIGVLLRATAFIINKRRR